MQKIRQYHSWSLTKCCCEYLIQRFRFRTIRCIRTFGLVQEQGWRLRVKLIKKIKSSKYKYEKIILENEHELKKIIKIDKV